MPIFVNLCPEKFEELKSCMSVIELRASYDVTNILKSFKHPFDNALPHEIYQVQRKGKYLNSNELCNVMHGNNN